MMTMMTTTGQTFTKRCNTPMLVKKQLKTHTLFHCPSCGVTDDRAFGRDVAERNTWTCNNQVPATRAEFGDIRRSDRERLLLATRERIEEAVRVAKSDWGSLLATLAKEGVSRLEWLDSTFEAGAALKVAEEALYVLNNTEAEPSESRRLRNLHLYMEKRALNFYRHKSSSVCTNLFETCYAEAVCNLVTRHLVPAIQTLDAIERDLRAVESV